jgi:chloramphenicol 3-O-phosphotransferase
MVRNRIARGQYERCPTKESFIGDNLHMEKSCAGARLIIICGLPGSGKTTLAKVLERKLGAVRFCADEWMNALSLNLYDEAGRGKIEALQWTFGQELLARGLKVVIEWGTWGRSNGIRCGLEHGPLVLLSSCTISMLLRISSSKGFKDGAGKSHK